MVHGEEEEDEEENEQRALALRVLVLERRPRLLEFDNEAPNDYALIVEERQVAIPLETAAQSGDL